MRSPQESQSRTLSVTILVAAFVLASLTLGAALSGATAPTFQAIASVSAVSIAVFAGLWFRIFRVPEPSTTQGTPDLPRVMEMQASAVRREPLARPGFQGVHALVVEDDPICQQVALGQLRVLGVTAELAADGLSALRALERRHYDVVLMDCQLPGIEGYEVTRRLRLQEGLNRQTPVIAVTANLQKENRERCMAAGMDQYMHKPLNLEILSGLLRRMLADGTSRRDARGVSTPTILDPKQIATLRQLEQHSGSPLLAPLAESFPKQVRQYLEQMREATRQDDSRALFFAAHTLKGAAFNLGAIELASLCREIEDSAQQGRTTGFDEKLGQVEQEIQKVVLELRQISEPSRARISA